MIEIEPKVRGVAQRAVDVSTRLIQNAVVKILLAEDDGKLLRHLSAGLREAGHTVDCAQDGAEARWAVENGTFDLLVLDIMMPQLDGVTLVRGLRRRGLAMPILFITARGEVRDRVAGLDAGADDYLVKPFSLDELLARIRALGRRQRVHGEILIRQQSEGETSHGNDFAIGNSQGRLPAVLDHPLSLRVYRRITLGARESRCSSF